MSRGGQNGDLNYLRSSISHGRGYKAIVELRQRIPISGIRRVVTTGYRVPNIGRYPLLAGITRAPRFLLSRAPYESIPFSLELEWAVCQIERWEKQISRFLAIRTRIERAFAQGDWEAAKSEVEAINQFCGISGWLIAAKTVVLQWSDGQDSQKAFALNIIENSNGLPVGIAHLCSQRNESAVSVSGYVARAENIIRDWKLNDAWATYLRWVVLGSAPETLNQANDLLRVATTGSIIDLYEATVSVLLGAATVQKSFAQNERDHLRLVVARLQRLPDVRMRSCIGTINGTRDVSADKSGSCSWFHDAVTAARRIDADPDDGLWDYLLTSLRSITNRFESAKASLQDLRKIALAFDFLPLAQTLGAFGEAIVANGCFPYRTVRSKVGQLLGGEQEQIWNGDFGGRENLIRTLELAAASADAEVLDKVCNELAAGDAFETITASKATFAAALVAGDWWEAIGIAVECLVRFPGAAHEFALAEIMSALRWSDLKAHAAELKLGVALAFALREASSESVRQKLQRHLQQSAIRILRGHGVKHFSELAKMAASDELLRCFLREACSESIMEVNTAISGSRALSEERMKICQELSVLDERNAQRYLDEIKQITFDLELEEGVRHFDSSRLSVNTEGLARWATSALAEDFSRYASLRESALPDVAEIRAALVSVQMGQTDEPIPKALLEQPRTEADRLLAEIAQKLSREFYLNPVFGLNAFLSLRVRHGSLAGHLRGPLEEAGVIASKREAGGYASIDRWEWIRRGFDDPDEFDRIFEKFSEKVDTIIEYIVDERLQVKTEAKPHGAFEDAVSVVLVNLLKLGLSNTATTTEIIDTCVTQFKTFLEPTLSNIRNEIGEDLKNRLNQALNEAMVDLQAAKCSHGKAELLDSFSRARTNLSVAVARVSEWFRPFDKEISDRTYSVEQSVRMGEKLTTNARPTFEPRIRLGVDSELSEVRIPQTGAFLIADALFIVLDNVYLHSGLDNPIDVDVDVSISVEGFIAFKVSNQTASFADLRERQGKLHQIRSQLESGEFKRRSVGEGGTGFFKLWRLSESVAQTGKPGIDFALEGGYFRVNFLAPLLLREYQEGAS